MSKRLDAEMLKLMASLERGLAQAMAGEYAAVHTPETFLPGLRPRPEIGRQNMNDIQTGQATNDEVSIRIIGQVVAPVAVPLAELRRLEHVEIADMPMRCGDGEPKGRTAHCQGVLLADVIGRAEALVTGHDDTKKMFVAAIADDGYMAVFFWQEIFNSPNGVAIFVVLAKNGQVLGDGGRADLLAGPRYACNLTTIEIVLAR